MEKALLCGGRDIGSIPIGSTMGLQFNGRISDSQSGDVGSIPAEPAKFLADYLNIPEICEYRVHNSLWTAAYPCGLALRARLANLVVPSELGESANKAHLLHHYICGKPEKGFWDLIFEENIDSKRFSFYCNCK